MNALFLKILNMSLSAGWLVLAVLVVRLALRNRPRWLCVLLWGIVAVRLVCPFSIESALSLMPSGETLPETVLSGPQFSVQTGLAPVDSRVNGYLGDRYFEGVTVPAHSGANLMTVLAGIWLAGAAALLVYGLIRFLLLRRRLATATLLRDNIRQSEYAPSPFVLGLFRPVIYLPYDLDAADLPYVIAHEQAHIRRLDPWWKAIGFVLLAVYWFHPLLWVAYVLLGRDIEAACDEKVIRDMPAAARQAYASALLHCSMPARRFALSPLAFGESGVKGRIRNIARYRKPAVWLVAAALVLCAAVAVVFLTDPPSDPADPDAALTAYTESLQSGITFADDTFSFPLPANLPEDVTLEMRVERHATYENGSGTAVYVLKAADDAAAAGQTYTISLEPDYDLLTLHLFYTNTEGAQTQHSIDLLALRPEEGSTAAVSLTEETAADCIAQTLATLTLHSDQTVSFTLPDTIPVSEDGRTRLEISLNATFRSAPDTYSVQSLVADDQAPGTWQAGQTYTGTLETSRGELVSLSMGVFFMTEVEADAFQIYASDSLEISAPFSYDTPAGYTSPAVQVRQDGTQVQLTFTLQDGSTPQLAFTLPAGVTVAEGDAAQPDSLLLVKGSDAVVGSISLYDLGTADPDALQSVDTGADELPMQVFAAVALSNHVAYTDYTVRRHWDTGAAATARYAWQALSDADAGAAADAPWQQADCVLAYDWAVMPRFVQIMWAEDTISAADLAALAESVQLTA